MLEVNKIQADAWFENENNRPIHFIFWVFNLDDESVIATLSIVCLLGMFDLFSFGCKELLLCFVTTNSTEELSQSPSRLQ